MADETLLSPRKKASHHHAAEPSRPSRHRGRLLPMLQKPLLHCAYNSAKLGVEGRGGEGGRELESHSLIRNFVPSWLVGALNFLCMNYDVRNSWLVSHQNEAPISAQGLAGDSDATFPLSLEQGRSLGCDIKAGRAKMLRVICHQGSEGEKEGGEEHRGLSLDYVEQGKYCRCCHPEEGGGLGCTTTIDFLDYHASFMQFATLLSSHACGNL